MGKVKIGLVLSGGGVRGVAHVGVIKALEEQGIKPTFISGASAGAIVGALYAAGHTPEIMLDFFRKTSLFSVRNYAVGKPGFVDTEKFYEIFREYFPKDNFAALEKDLYICVTELVSGKAKFFHEGPLIQPLLASAAFPGVFSPVQIKDGIYADGGITNNFPIEPLLTVCDKIIGVYVHPLKKVKPENLKNALSVMERAYSISRASHSMLKFSNCDLIISPDSLNRFSTFSMNSIDEIYQIGYDMAKQDLTSSDSMDGFSV